MIKTIQLSLIYLSGFNYGYATTGYMCRGMMTQIILHAKRAPFMPLSFPQSYSYKPRLV